jgi:putative chitinase
MDLNQFAKAIGCSTATAAVWLAPMTEAMAEYQIGTTTRQAAFLAQIGHESGGLRWLKEIWGPTDAQKKYEPPSDKASQLGNTQAGDGFRYRGRGPIQITGRDNYVNVSNALDHDFVTNPDDLASPEWASKSAAWWWASHALNQQADRNTDQSFLAITRTINGGTNGLADRQERWKVAKQALGAP